MPNPIYQTIRGELQATMEGGVLFVRDWPRKGATGEWRRLAKTADECVRDYGVANLMGDRTAADRARCLRDCLIDNRYSPFFVEPESYGLKRELDRALAAEAADRPKVGASA